MLLILAGIGVIILDQLVKYLVVQNIAVGSVVPFIPNVLSLTCVHNDGAAFSFLSGGGARALFIALALVFVAAVAVIIRKGVVKDRLERLCLVMMAAGGLANCIDRIVCGYVIDMFRVELFNFAVFNVADIFITVFTFIFAIKVLFTREEKPR